MHVAAIRRQRDHGWKRPMLVVCYTNHALDQFLEGILSFFDGPMVRVGSRSSSEMMQSLTLNQLKKKKKDLKKTTQNPLNLKYILSLIHI